MEHPSSHQLFAYWNELRGERSAPERRDIEPGVIRKALGDTFILAFEPAAGHVFRLAGTRVCALFGRELKGEPVTAVWDAASRAAMTDMLAMVADEEVGVVAGAIGRTAEGFSSDLELILLPLRHRGRPQERMIGVLSPMVAPFWLGTSRVKALTLGIGRHLEPVVTIVAPAASSRRPTPPRRRSLMIADLDKWPGRRRRG